VKNSGQDELFARARGEASPSDDDRRRVRSALAKRLGAVAGATVGATALKAAASTLPAGTTATTGLAAGGASLSAIGLVKAAVAIAVVSVAAVVATSALPAKHGERPMKTATVAEPVAAAPPAMPPSSKTASPSSVVSEEQAGTPHEASSVVSLPVATPALPGASLPPTKRPPAGEVASPPGLPSAAAWAETVAPSPPTVRVEQSAAELELMANVQTALRQDDAARVLALVHEHERRFPNSALAPEREGARVLAMCGSAPSSEAKALAQTFLRAHPLSPLGGRVRATCGLADPSR
jgi:hypothetical protein